MKKLLIILAFLLSTFVSWGQVGQWDSTQTIIYPTATTGKIPLSITDTIYLIDVLPSDSGNAYINRRSGVQMVYDFNQDAADDTIPAVILFQNYDFDSLFYSRVSEKALNSDSTINLPQRITEIEVYSTITDRDSYFNVPFVLDESRVRVRVVPDEYATPQLAIDASSNLGDTIIIKSGTYYNSTYLTVNKDIVTLQGIGDVKFTNNAGQSYCIYNVGADSSIIRNIQIESDATYNIYFNQALKSVLKNCYISGSSRNEVFARGTSEVDNIMTISNNVLFSTDSNGFGILRVDDADFLVNENVFIGTDAYGIYDNFVLNQDRSIKIMHNSICDGSYRYFHYNIFKNIDISFNDVDLDTCQSFTRNARSTDLYQNVKVRYNNYKVDYNPNETDGFLKYYFTGDRDLDIVVENNNIEIGSTSVPIYLYAQHSVDIHDNTIDIYRGTSILVQPRNNDSVTVTIENNKLSQHFSDDSGGDWMVNIGTFLDTLNHSTLIVENNEFKSPLYYGSAIGGHTCLYIANIKYREIRYNYFYGNTTGSIVDKGVNTVAEGLECEGGYYSNIFLYSGAIIKGIRNIEIFNNTFYNQYLLGAIRYYRNEDDATYEDSRGGKVFNNIISTDTATTECILVNTTADSVGFESNNNVLWGGDLVLTNSIYSLTEWQALGYDVNSFNADPLLSATLCPDSNSPANGSGVDVGQDSLIVCGATYPNPEKIAVFAPFDMGAIEIPAPPKTINSAVRVIGGGQWIYKRTKVGY